MIALGLTVLAAALSADEVPSTPAKLCVVAVQGLMELPEPAARAERNGARPLPTTNLAPSQRRDSGAQERFGPGLKEVRRALAGLDYKAFRRINRVEKSVKYLSEARVELNDRYAMYVKPMSRDERGRVRLNVRVEMAPKKKGEKPINVVSNTTIALVPGKQANVGGMRLEEGELIVVLWVPPE